MPHFFLSNAHTVTVDKQCEGKNTLKAILTYLSSDVGRTKKAGKYEQYKHPPIYAWKVFIFFSAVTKL
jgi:hypothetical protein